MRRLPCRWGGGQGAALAVGLFVVGLAAPAAWGQVEQIADKNGVPILPQDEPFAVPINTFRLTVTDPQQSLIGFVIQALGVNRLLDVPIGGAAHSSTMLWEDPFTVSQPPQADFVFDPTSLPDAAGRLEVYHNAQGGITVETGIGMSTLGNTDGVTTRVDVEFAVPLQVDGPGDLRVVLGLAGELTEPVSPDSVVLGTSFGVVPAGSPKAFLPPTQFGTRTFSQGGFINDFGDALDALTTTGVGSGVIEVMDVDTDRIIHTVTPEAVDTTLVFYGSFSITYNNASDGDLYSADFFNSMVFELSPTEPGTTLSIVPEPNSLALLTFCVAALPGRRFRKASMTRSASR